MRITLCEIWAEGGATHAKERELDLEDGVIAEEALAQAGRRTICFRPSGGRDDGAS